MHYNALLAAAATLSGVSASAIQGFNYGSTNADGSYASQSDFESQFTAAKALAGTNGAFTAARLYTTIQGGTTSNPTSAIPAAVASKTRLLLGMWASSGSATITDEINALKSAMSLYGESFTSLVDAISVGSEDLYRTTATSLMNDPNSVGASPSDVVDYIGQVRKALAGTALSGAKIGHVDTWTAWVNSSNSAVAEACDFIGMDAYPYFQTTMANGISNGKALFDSAWQQTMDAAQGKEVWITETAWPSSGKTSNDAVASTSNAQQYWEAVGCDELFGKVNTYWYTYYDGTPNPSFGLVDSVGGAPRFDLSCKVKASMTSGVASTIGGGVYSTSGASFATYTASATGSASTGSSTGTSSGSSGSGSGSGSGNGTIGTSAGSGGALPPSPTSTGTVPATGAAATNAMSFVGLLGAVVAALVL